MRRRVFRSSTSGIHEYSSYLTPCITLFASISVIQMYYGTAEKIHPKESIPVFIVFCCCITNRVGPSTITQPCEDASGRLTRLLGLGLGAQNTRALNPNPKRRVRRPDASSHGLCYFTWTNSNDGTGVCAYLNILCDICTSHIVCVHTVVASRALIASAGFLDQFMKDIKKLLNRRGGLPDAAARVCVISLGPTLIDLVYYCRTISNL